MLYTNHSNISLNKSSIAWLYNELRRTIWLHF